MSIAASWFFAMKHVNVRRLDASVLKQSIDAVRFAWLTETGCSIRLLHWGCSLVAMRTPYLVNNITLICSADLRLFFEFRQTFIGLSCAKLYSLENISQYSLFRLIVVQSCSNLRSEDFHSGIKKPRFPTMLSMKPMTPQQLPFVFSQGRKQSILYWRYFIFDLLIITYDSA